MYLKLGIPMVGGNNAHESILQGIKNKNVVNKKLKRYRKSNEDIKLESYLQSSIKEKVKHGRIGRSMSMMVKHDPLMDELRKKLKGKRKKSLAIEFDNEIEKKEECVGDDDDEEVKPALPNKSARMVEQQIRSKYQRPLPALPQGEKVNKFDII
eukprot:UN01302